ncbi:unnamed protein product [Mytilus coruscus]|uniref:Uncharacterized protein n=1 Tax=Mytilus coruscus TaxID=42192 RepID=A0A6J8CRW1_MYTCO|nr:unnamed protein product [Mytilus coruscus]
MCVDTADKIYRLSDSQQCTIKNTDKSDIIELVSLILGLTGSMNSICEVLTKRMDNFEKNIPRQVAAMINTKISEEIIKVKDQFKVDLNAVTDKVNKMETSYTNVVKAYTDRTRYEENNSLVIHLENSNKSQNDLNQMYCEFVKVVKTEMSSKLPCKTYITDGYNNKRRRCKKPWWNEELTVLWNCVCSAKQIWNKAACNKSSLRHDYVQKRKQFDKVCQRSKRQYWYSMQEELKNFGGKSGK